MTAFGRQPLPSEASPAGDAARRIARLHGPVLQPADGTNIAAEFLALGQALVDAVTVALASIDEAFVDRATQLLAEWEAVHGLDVRPDLTTAQRRTRLVAAARAQRGAMPRRIERAASTVSGALGTTQVLENTVATVLPVDPTLRGVFQWALSVPAAAFADADLLAQFRALVAKMKPAHTRGDVIVNAAFFTDDSNSLVDRDAVGA